MNYTTPKPNEGQLPLVDKDDLESMQSDDFQKNINANFEGTQTLEELQKEYILENDAFYKETKEDIGSNVQDKAADFIGEKTGLNLGTVHVYGQILDVTSIDKKERSIIKIIYQKELKAVVKQSVDFKNLLKMNSDVIKEVQKSKQYDAIEKVTNQDLADEFNTNNLLFVKGFYRWDRLDYFNYDQTYYFVTVMQYMPNNLGDEIERRKMKNKRFSHVEMIGILKKCVKGLLFLTKTYKLNHGNLKPSNILIEDQNVLLSDYGINHIFDLPLFKPQIVEVFDSQYKKKTLPFFSPEKRQNFDKFQYNKQIDEELVELKKLLEKDRKTLNQDVEQQMLDQARENKLNNDDEDKIKSKEEKKEEEKKEVEEKKDDKKDDEKEKQKKLFSSYKLIKKLKKNLKELEMKEQKNNLEAGKKEIEIQKIQLEQIRNEFEDTNGPERIKEIKDKIKYLTSKKQEVSIDSDSEEEEGDEGAENAAEKLKKKIKNGKVDKEKNDIWALGMVALQMSHLFTESNMEHLNSLTDESKIDLKKYIEEAGNYYLEGKQEVFLKALENMLELDQKNRIDIEGLNTLLNEYTGKSEIQRRQTVLIGQLKWIDFEENIFLKIRLEYFDPWILAYFLWLLIADVLLMKLIGLIYLKPWYQDKLINIWGLCMIVIEFNFYLVLMVLYFINMKYHGQTTEKAVFLLNQFLLVYKTVECAVLLPSFGEPSYIFVIVTYFLDLIAYFYYNIKLRKKSVGYVLKLSLGILITVGTLFLFLYEIVCWYYWANILNGESLGSSKDDTKNEGGTVTYEACVQRKLYEAFVYINVFTFFFVGGKILLPLFLALYKFFYKYKFEIYRKRLTVKSFIIYLQLTFSISSIVWGVLLMTQVDKCQLYQEVYVVKGNKTIILIMLVINLFYSVVLLFVRLYLSKKLEYLTKKRNPIEEKKEEQSLINKMLDDQQQKTQQQQEMLDDDQKKQQAELEKEQLQKKEINLSKTQQTKQQPKNQETKKNNEDYLDEAEQIIGNQDNQQHKSQNVNKNDNKVDIQEIEQQLNSIDKKVN